MPVRFLLGPAGSGKTHSCLESLRTLERRGKPGIYLVPEQYTYSADRELLDTPDLAGLRHVRVFSFHRLGWWLRERAWAPGSPAIPEAVRPMLLRAVLARMPASTLGPLAPLKDRQGFLEELGRFIGEVRNHGTVDFLERVGQGGGVQAPKGVRQKITALAAVFEAYSRAVRDLGRTDPEEHLAGLSPLIARLGDSLSGVGFFVDGFLSWTRREREILVSLGLTGAPLEIALCCDPVVGVSDDSIPIRAPFLPVRRSLRDLEEAFRRAGVAIEPAICFPRQCGRPVVQEGSLHAVGVPADEAIPDSGPPTRFAVPALQVLERELYREGPMPQTPPPPLAGQITLQPARDPRQEVLCWARTIDQWIRAGAERVPPGQVAVLVRNVEPYRDLVRETFPRYRIPFFLDEKRTLLAHPRVRLLLDAFEVLLSGWRRDAVITFLRNPLLGAAPAVIDLLENLSLEYGHDFEAWYAPEWPEYPLPARVRFHRRPERDPAEGAEEDSLEDVPDEETPGEVAEDEPIEPARDGRVAWTDPVRRRLLDPLRRMQEVWHRGPQIAPPIADLRSDPGSPESRHSFGALTGPEAVAALREFETAFRSRPGGTDMAAALGEFQPKGTPAVDPEPAWTRRVESTVEELLEEISRLWGRLPVRLEEFSRTLRQGCEAARVGITPLRCDQVMVGDVQRTRLYSIRRAIVGGLNEGLFPRVVPDDAILNEQDRAALRDAGLSLGPAAATRQEEEVYFFYIALSRASQEILLTWSGLDGQGKAMTPSLFLQELGRALPGTRPEPPPPEPEEAAPVQIQTPLELGERLVAHLATLIRSEAETSPDPVLLELYNRIVASVDTPPTSGSLEAPAVAVPRSVPDSVGPSAVQSGLNLLELSRPALLYKPEGFLPDDLRRLAFADPDFYSSVTRLQQYASCPYQSFARSLLRLEPRPRAEVSPLETGSLAHAALERFFRAPTGACDSEIDARLGQVFNELKDLPEFRAFQVDEASRYRWHSTGRSLSRFLRLEMSRLDHASYKPHAHEIDFGPREGNAVPIPLPGGGRLWLVGRLDRLDRREDPLLGPMGLVLDYKRSPKQGLPRALVRGLDLQIAAYLLYVRDVLGWVPVGGFYVPVLPGPKRAEELGPQGVNPLKLKLHGIYLSEERDAIDGGKEMVTAPRRGGQGIEGIDSMTALLETGRSFLARFAATWRSGWIAPVPLEAEVGRLPCQNCDFAAVCRYRPGRDPVRREPGEGMVDASSGPPEEDVPKTGGPR